MRVLLTNEESLWRREGDEDQVWRGWDVCGEAGTSGSECGEAGMSVAILRVSVARLRVSVAWLERVWRGCRLSVVWLKSECGEAGESVAGWRECGEASVVMPFFHPHFLH